MVERNRPDDDRGRSGGSTRGKWHYEPQKAEDIRARATRTSGRFDSIFKPGFDTFRPKGGDNLVRFLPGTWNLGVAYAYDVWVHRYVGPDDSTYLCLDRMLGKQCPICDAAAEAKRAKDDEEAKQLRVLQQGVAWILDRRGEMPKQPLLFQMSRTLDSTILSLTNIKEQIWIDNPTEGFDVTIKRSGTGLNTRYIAAIDRDPSPIAEKQRDFDKIMDYIETNPLDTVLHYFDADYLDRVMSGTTGPRDDKEEVRGRERERDDRDEREEPRRDRDRDGERDERAVRSRRDEPEPERARSSRRDEPEPDREERSPRRGRDEPEPDRPGRRAARDEAKDEEDEDRAGRGRREPDDAPSRRDRRSDPEEEDQARDERRARGNGARRDDKDEPPFDADPPARSRRERADEDEESRPRRSVERQRPDDEPRAARRGDDDEEDRRPPRRR
jgi:hypothetical protein